jgi:transcriptional regulator with XRE-family HTH domain
MTTNAFAKALDADLTDLYHRELPSGAAPKGKQKVSYDQLAQRLGIRQQAVSKWVKAGRPSIENYEALIAILGKNSRVAQIPFKELFGAESAGGVMHRRPDAVIDAGKHMQKAQDRALMDFAKGLPSPLRDHIGVQVATIGEELTYASPRVAAHLLALRDGQYGGDAPRALLALAAVRASDSRRQVLLLVCSPEGADPLPLPLSLAMCAGALGVQVVRAKSGAAAAKAIEAAEGGAF